MPGLRHQARSIALQLLYQSELQSSNSDAEVALGQLRTPLWAEVGLSKRKQAFATALYQVTMAHQVAIDARLAMCLEHWKLSRVPVVVRNLLRLGVGEMIHLHETPHAIVIDEAVALAREFVDEASAKFVNGVLQRCWDTAGLEAVAAGRERESSGEAASHKAGVGRNTGPNAKGIARNRTHGSKQGSDGGGECQGKSSDKPQGAAAAEEAAESMASSASIA